MPSDFFNRWSEQVHVIQTQWRHTADDRLPDDIGAVKSTTNSDLDNGDIYFLLKEHVEGHRQKVHKVRRVVSCAYLYIHVQKYNVNDEVFFLKEKQMV